MPEMASQPPNDFLLHYKIERRAPPPGSWQKLGDSWIRGPSIGHGAFGKIFKEENSKTGSVRAIKEVRRRYAGQNLMAELQALTRLCKPANEGFFVKFQGWYEEDFGISIAMEFIELGDLRKHMHTAISESQVKMIAFQLLDGLRTMHIDGYTHRDIKPENIFVVRGAPEWCIKIGDFGVSKHVLNNDTSLRSEVGTGPYMAPEIFKLLLYGSNPSTYNNSVDIWSAGIVVHELLCQTRPFKDFHVLSHYYSGYVEFPDESLLRHKITTRGRDFVKLLLARASPDRPAADDALSSDWFTSESTEEESSPPDLISYQTNVASSAVHKNENTNQSISHGAMYDMETTRTTVTSQLAATETNIHCRRPELYHTDASQVHNRLFNSGDNGEDIAASNVIAPLDADIMDQSQNTSDPQTSSSKKSKTSLGRAKHFLRSKFSVEKPTGKTNLQEDVKNLDHEASSQDANLDRLDVAPATSTDKEENKQNLTDSLNVRQEVFVNPMPPVETYVGTDEVTNTDSSQSSPQPGSSSDVNTMLRDLDLARNDEILVETVNPHPYPKEDFLPWKRVPVKFPKAHKGVGMRTLLRVFPAICSADEETIYVNGGLVRSGNPPEPKVLNDTWRLHIKSDEVSCKRAGPEKFSKRYDHRAIFTEDKMFIIGGRGVSGAVSSDVVVMDLNYDKVHYIPETPKKMTPFLRTGIALAGSRLFTLGGWKESAGFPYTSSDPCKLDNINLYACDLDNLESTSGKRWNLVQTVQKPMYRSCPALVQYQGDIILIGGAPHCKLDVWQYGVVENEWNCLHQGFQNDYCGFAPTNGQAEIIGNIVFVWETVDGVTPMTPIFIHGFNILERTWHKLHHSTLPPFFKPGQTMTAAGSKLIMLSGEKSETPADYLHHNVEAKSEYVWMLETDQVLQWTRTDRHGNAVNPEVNA